MRAVPSTNQAHPCVGKSTRGVRAVACWPKPRRRTIAFASNSREANNALGSFIQSVQDALTRGKSDPVKGLRRDLSSGSVQVQPNDASQGEANGNVQKQGNGSKKAGGEGAQDSKDPESKIESQEPDSSPSVIVATHKSIFELDKEEWNACVTSAGDVNPFLLHEFFGALESSGSASPQRGWVPCHIAIRESSAQISSEAGDSKTATENAAKPISGSNGAYEQKKSSQQEIDRLKASSGRLLAVVPAYLKSHSYGEYVFDHSWANLYAQMGVNYYPKLQCAVPFSPVPGARLLVAPGEDPAELRKTILRVLPQVADALKVSSVHMTFNTVEEWELARESPGWLSRMGLQFHWENDGYKTFDDFLAALKQSKRKSIRQERKSMAKQNLRIERLQGSQITPEIWDAFYDFYIDTTDRKWGSAYLTKDFFLELGASLQDRVLLIVAYDDSYSSELPVAGALNLVGSDALYGRNWGCRFGDRYKHLHFELCYYQAIEAAIELGLQRVEAGAQGMHKISRGYLPNATYSNHYIRLPQAAMLLNRFLKREAEEMSQEIEILTAEASPFKQPPQSVTEQADELRKVLRDVEAASASSDSKE